jgi:hypothetical protein
MTVDDLKSMSPNFRCHMKVKRRNGSNVRGRRLRTCSQILQHPRSAVIVIHPAFYSASLTYDARRFLQVIDPNVTLTQLQRNAELRSRKGGVPIVRRGVQCYTWCALVEKRQV